jgi:type II secretory pathway pseudopilin PulG
MRDMIMRPQTKRSTSTRQDPGNTGFSQIELLIVILIIAAVAIPNFIRSKEAANEASAVQNLRNISMAE